MTEIASTQGLKRDREAIMGSTEHDAGLLQMLRAGSLQHSAEQALMNDPQRPPKRQAVQSPSLPWQQHPSVNVSPMSLHITSPGMNTNTAPAAGSHTRTLNQMSGQISSQIGASFPPLTSPQIAQQMRTLLGDKGFLELRTHIITQQEQFATHVRDMHMLAARQTQSVQACENTAALHAEFQRLQAEQDIQSDSDNTVEQEDGLIASGQDQSVPNQKVSGGSSKVDTVGTQDGPPGQIPNNILEAQRHMQAHGYPPNMMQGSGDPWSMYRQNYMNCMNAMNPVNPYTQQGMQGWGMAMMGGSFPGSFPGPYRNYGVMPPPMDPMLAWYTLHYGQQYHQAMANQANAAAAKAQQEAQERDKADRQPTGGSKDGSKPVRWWQDPEKVFGLAGDPNVLANHEFKAAARHRAQEKLRDRSEATSKPPTLKKKNSGDVASEKGESIEKPAEIGSQPKSASKNTGDKPVSAEGHQKAGSGLSAFKSLATKSGRKPPTRAESIGSEMSRSGADQHYTVFEADSGDIRNAAHGPKGPDT